MIEGVPDPMPIGLNACAGQDPRLRQSWVRFEDIRSGGWDPAERLKEIEIAGVDAEVLYPTPRLAQAIYGTTDSELHLALVQAYNDWIHEYASHDLGRFRALAIVPNRGVDHALAEIARVGDRPSTGGVLLGAYPGGTVKPSADDDPVFAALVEQRLTVNVHVSLSNTLPTGAPTLLALPAAGRFTAATNHLIDLVFSGIFDRFPTLNMVFAEVDCGWLPYFSEQADDNFLRHSRSSLRDHELTKLPSEYMRQHFPATFINDNYAVENRHRIGVERMLWSNDYPHITSDWPMSWKTINASFADVPPHERHAILSGNAQRIFGFGR